MNIMNGPEEPATGLRWLFLDMNSFFASCEQQENPALRGRPVAVVPMLAQTTCAIAASYEAKAFGVKTGTLVKDARAMCPDIIFVPARPKLYVQTHHRFLDAIEKCMPIEAVMSIDEVACRLDKREQNPTIALDLARRIKKTMRDEVGEVLTCSIGIASNRLLAKLASNMQKPDGLTLLHPDDMPRAILHLAPSAFSGIGPRMALRLTQNGIHSMQDLWDADASFLRRVWGGVMGARFHALLHGADLKSPTSPRRSMGHQHVLAPQERSLHRATPIIRQLMTRLAARLRKDNFYARRLMLDIKWQGQLGYFVDEARFTETQDSGFLLRTLMGLWQKAPNLKPLRIGVTLAELVPAQKHQYDLFAAPKNNALTAAIDKINEKYGRGCVSYGEFAGPTTSKIAFQRVPEMGEV